MTSRSVGPTSKRVVHPQAHSGRPCRSRTAPLARPTVGATVAFVVPPVSVHDEPDVVRLSVIGCRAPRTQDVVMSGHPDGHNGSATSRIPGRALRCAK